MIFHSIGDRLRSERERLKLSQAELAEVGGVKPLTQHSYEKGSSYPNADYLAKVNDLGVDALYVVTGERARSRQASRGTAGEIESLVVLQSRGIYPDGEGGGRVSSAGLALLLDYVRESKDNRTTKLTAKELQKVSSFVPKDAREWLLQPVALTPYQDGKASYLLLLFRCKTPVAVVWKVGPFPGQIPSRIDITTDSELPLMAVSDEDDDVRWQLDLTLDGAHETLLKGVELRANLIPIDFARKQMAVQKIVNVQVGGDVGQSIAGNQTNTGPMSFSVGKRK
jgi:transcriptional regulator with XRE-family HTH domain